MTGRELAAAIRPLEQWATAMARFGQIAQEAIRLEEGLAQTTRRLVALQADVTAAQATLTTLQAESRDLAATLRMERAAAEAETAERCAARVAEADGLVADRRHAAETWATREAEARQAHETRMAEWRAEESALREHVDGLRDLAQRMAQAAGAVLR